MMVIVILKKSLIEVLLTTWDIDQMSVAQWHLQRLKPYRKYFIVLPDDAVERRKLGVNKERTTVALKGFI